MNMGVENFDFNGGYYYMNSPTVYESNNHNFVYSTKKGYEIFPNRYEMENNLLQCGV